jgi:hypothetical protein
VADKEVLAKITAAISAVVTEKNGGVPLTHAAAYSIGHAAALEHFRGLGTIDDAKELGRISHSATVGCYYAARQIIAKQFVGSTFASLSEDIALAAERFSISADSDAPPDLTLLAKHPERIDFWKLLAYAIAIRHAAYRDLEEGESDLDSVRKLAGIERAVQLLHMLTQEDILIADLAERPFAGQVREQRRRAPLLS